jgi:hypothetical protein
MEDGSAVSVFIEGDKAKIGSVKHYFSSLHIREGLVSMCYPDRRSTR